MQGARPTPKCFSSVWLVGVRLVGVRLVAVRLVAEGANAAEALR